MKRVYVSVLLALLLTRDSMAVGLSPIGIVSHAERAHVGVGSASAGTTLYDGDHLTTEAGGELALRSRSMALQMEQDTSLTLGSAQAEQGLVVDLASGTVIVSSVDAFAVVVRANGATLVTREDAPTIAHVRVVGPKELRVFAQRGALDFSFRDEIEQIPEGACYRVLLDADGDDNPSNSGRAGGQAAKVGIAHKSFLFVTIAVGAAAAAAVEKSHHPHPHPHESPDRP